MADSTALVPQDVIAAVSTARGLAEIKIVTADDYQKAGASLVMIHGWGKAAEEHRKSLTRPIDEQKAAVMDAFRPAIMSLETSESLLRSAMMNWHRADLAARQEAERIAREAQAAETARLREEQKAAEAEGNIERAVQLNYEAEYSAAPMVAPQVAKVSGVGHREKWTFEVTDFQALLRAVVANPEAYGRYVVPNMVAIGGAVRSAKKDFAAPGITAWDAGSVTVTGGRS